MSGNGEPLPKLTIPSPVVQFLERLLEDAKNNNINSIGVVIITNTQQIGTVHMGPLRGDLFTGAALLSKRILNDIDPPAGSAARSPIIRATMGG